MDKVIATNLIQELFEQSFSKEKFIYFIKNLLNNIKDDTFIYRGNYIPEVYRGYIKTIERIGKYQDQNEKKIDILIVTLEKETTLERARTLQRNIIAWYLNGSRGGQLKDAALVAFVSPNNNDWRFSYVKMEYKFVKTDKGTVKVKEELTPAKRYSFLVGPNEASHTAQSQMVPILINDKIDPTFEEIEKIFNIETVSKEFFEKYRSLYEMLVKELDNNQTFKNEAKKNNINTSNFSKKLLGQIVFLYFLQKKGWLGVNKGKTWGEGDKFFLSHLFKDCIDENKNYFNDYLEILFYDTLNNARSEKVDRNYSDHFKSKIPFLNGGLFEPQYDWKKSFIYLDNKTFKQILDVFDLYNFTVKEDEPLEKDVAVDPEMLGKVFENLLEENLRKGKGTFYTPREIVHYMCQESLINYLQKSTNIGEQTVRKLVLVDKTINPTMDLKKQIKEKSLVLSNQQVEEFDQALNNITICDPACGSGAFLVGMLQLIVSTKNKINGYKRLFEINIEDKTEYDLKKRTIQNSIYGVDIDSGAVEIAKLRLWLSLVVDYDLEDIEPLPNLDYKIMVGNSLIEKLDIKKLEKTIDDDKNKLIDEVKNLKEKYFETSELKTKTNLRFQINETIRLLINYDNKQKREKIRTQFTDKKNQMKMFLFDGEQQTFDDIKTVALLETFKDIKETDHFEWHINFNEVFENGGFDVVIANPPYGVSLKGTDRDLIIKFLSKVPDFEIYYFFLEKGKMLLKNQGVLSYIIPNTFLFNVFATNYRLKLINEWFLKLIIDCTNFKLFENATVYNAIVIFVKGHINNYVGYKNTFDSSSFNELINRETSIVPIQTLLENNRNWGLTFKLPKINLEIVSKIKKQSAELKTYFPDISQGLIAYDKYRGQKEETIKKRAYHFKSKIREDLKPWLNGEDIKKYSVKWSMKEWIDYGKGIANPRQPKFFRGKRILIREITNPSIYAGYTQDELYNDPSILIILDNNSEPKADLFYLLGYLNSKLATFYHFNSSPKATKGAFPKILIKDIQEFPIIIAKNQKPIIQIVEKIISITKNDDYLINQKKKAQVQEYEKQIDQMVYELYELTGEEIKIVEC